MSHHHTTYYFRRNILYFWSVLQHWY